MEGAVALRREWMTLMGLDESEIAEACAEPDLDADEERHQLDAMKRVIEMQDRIDAQIAAQALDDIDRDPQQFLVR